MDKHPIGLVIFLLIIVALLHAGGLYLHLYWQFSWLDSVVHTIAGSIVAIVALMILQNHLQGKTAYKISYGIGIALIIGIVWEFYELKTGAAVPSDIQYPLDTIGDLSFDTLGAIIGSFFMIWRNKQRN